MSIAEVLRHKISGIFFSTFLLLTSGFSPALSEENRVVKFVWVEGWEEVSRYRLDVLKLALSRQNQPFTVELDESAPSQNRAASIVLHSETPKIMAMGANKQFERSMLPVYAPVYLGIGSGYRLMLISKKIQNQIRRVRNLNDLKEFSVGQGKGWSDVEILENAGLEVFGIGKEDRLIRMTAANRFDLYSRGLFEIFPEFEENKDEHPELAIDDHLLIVYPFAIFFFTGPAQTELRDAILEGMRNIYASGELQDLLVSHPTTRGTLNKADLAARTRIDLPPFGISEEAADAIRDFRFVPGKKIGAKP